MAGQFPCAGFGLRAGLDTAGLVRLSTTLSSVCGLSGLGGVSGRGFPFVVSVDSSEGSRLLTGSVSSSFFSNNDIKETAGGIGLLSGKAGAVKGWLLLLFIPGLCLDPGLLPTRELCSASGRGEGAGLDTPGPRVGEADLLAARVAAIRDGDFGCTLGFPLGMRRAEGRRGEALRRLCWRVVDGCVAAPDSTSCRLLPVACLLNPSTPLLSFPFGSETGDFGLGEAAGPFPSPFCGGGAPRRAPAPSFPRIGFGARGVGFGGLSTPVRWLWKASVAPCSAALRAVAAASRWRLPVTDAEEGGKLLGSPGRPWGAMGLVTGRRRAFQVAGDKVRVPSRGSTQNQLLLISFIYLGELNKGYMNFNR